MPKKNTEDSRQETLVEYENKGIPQGKQEIEVQGPRQKMQGKPSR
jgi:hypothetical protein